MASDSDLVANADLVIEEARRQLDAQLTTAGEVDGRAGTLLGLIGGVTGIAAIFGDLNLGEPDKQPLRWFTVIAAAFLAIGSSVFLTWSLWPTGHASYGANLAESITQADQLDETTFKRAVARAMLAARNENVSYLSKRQFRLKVGIVLFTAAVIAVVLIVASGAFVAPPVKPT